VSGEEIECACAELPRRRAVARDLDAEAFENLAPTSQLFLLLLARELGRRRVRVAVVSKLVASGDDLLDSFRVVLGDAAGHEERRRHLVAGEQVEDQRHSNLGAVDALREDARPPGVLRVVGDPDLLGVEVEGEREGGSRPVRPQRCKPRTHAQVSRRRGVCTKRSETSS
jgi:hypothetical protein